MKEHNADTTGNTRCASYDMNMSRGTYVETSDRIYESSGQETTLQGHKLTAGI
jgi:hypothetical protein